MRIPLVVHAIFLGWSSLASWAEPIGVLSRLGPGQVTFLEGSTVRHFAVNAELGRNLARAGLGSRWEFWSTGSRLDSVVPRGRDRDLMEALQVLRWFIESYK